MRTVSSKMCPVTAVFINFAAGVDVSVWEYRSQISRVEDSTRTAVRQDVAAGKNRTREIKKESSQTAKLP